MYKKYNLQLSNFKSIIFSIACDIHESLLTIMQRNIETVIIVRIGRNDPYTFAARIIHSDFVIYW